MWFSLALVLITQTPGAPAPDRLDLGRAYMRFEQALARNPLPDARVVEVNRAFDALTADFFMGNSGAAIEKLAQLTRSVTPDLKSFRELPALDADFVLAAPADPAGQLEATLRLGADDGMLACERLGIEFSPLRPDGKKGFATSPATTGADSGSGSGARLLRGSFEYAAIRDSYDAGLACPPAEAANPNLSNLLTWAAFGCEDRRLIPYAFLETPGLVERRAEIADLLARMEPDGPPLEQALASCLARAALLNTNALKTSTYLIGRNVHALADEVHREAHALARGEDPYRRLSGDTWRVVRIGTEDLPVRVFAPQRVDLEKPLPLVVLFHGMGGDENMFFDGYGAGRIRGLAQERGFLCVAPRGSLRPFSAESFDALLRALLFDYAIDTKRIYVVGHSLGAGSAFELAVSRAERIAGAVCIAGGPTTAEPKALAPLLVVAGELDPLVAAKPLISRGKRLAQAGFSVECRSVPNQGHTLVVAATLPAVVEWLLDHTR